jgi:hypothetical protein
VPALNVYQCSDAWEGPRSFDYLAHIRHIDVVAGTICSTPRVLVTDASRSRMVEVVVNCEGKMRI